MGVISDLMGTFSGILNLTKTGALLKGQSSAVQIRNHADDEHANLEAASMRLKYPGESNLLTISPADMAANVDLTFPPDVGSAGDVLTSDGTGVLSWQPTTAGGEIIKKVAFSQASSSPLAILTPPNNATIVKIRVDVESAGGANSPTLAVGISGDTGKYMTTGQNDLKATGSYETNPSYEEDGTPDAIIATITPDSQSFSGFIYVHYAVPIT